MSDLILTVNSMLVILFKNLLFYNHCLECIDDLRLCDHSFNEKVRQYRYLILHISFLNLVKFILNLKLFDLL